jgi:hypothetical protein
VADSWGKSRTDRGAGQGKNAEFSGFLKQTPPDAAFCSMKADGHPIPKMKKIGKK